MMIVSFFEEFPDKKSLDKLKLITWPTKLYLASKSLKKFNKIKSTIKNKNVKEIIYWPILEINEGYWISPFSKKEALLRIFNEIKDNTSIMLDLELPTTKNPFLYISQLPNFNHNKKLINNFVKNHKEVYTAEIYPCSFLSEIILSLLNLHINPRKYNNNIIKMIYSSMHDFGENKIRNLLKRYNKKFNKTLIGLGTISIGIEGNEPILSYEKLERDLKLVKKANIKEVIIFRLNGLNKKYISIIKKNLN